MYPSSGAIVDLPRLSRRRHARATRRRYPSCRMRLLLVLLCLAACDERARTKNSLGGALVEEGAAATTPVFRALPAVPPPSPPPRPSPTLVSVAPPAPRPPPPA